MYKMQTANLHTLSTLRRLFLTKSQKFPCRSDVGLEPLWYRYQYRRQNHVFFGTQNGRSEDCEHRHHGVIVHPDSIAGKILPGNVVLRTTRSGIQKLRSTELEYGHYWMIKDLKQTGEKPILANQSLIDERSAKIFPTVKGATSLSGNSVDFPGAKLF